MAKSKRKSGSSTDVSRWETELNQISINEDDWKALIVFVVPDCAQNEVHLSIMSDIILSGVRKLFSVIDYESLLKEVKDLAHGKSMKGKIGKPPQFVEIIDQMKNVIDHGEDISSSLLAKLLKFKLLLLKQKDLERRDEEKKAAESAMKLAKQEHRSRSKTGSSQGKRSKSQSPNRKKGKKDELPSSPKKDTKLKRRGEDNETVKTIDDEPDTDGCPSHYVVINGVYDARVLKCLMDLGVTADAVIRVKSEIGQTDVEQNPTGEEKNMDIDENVSERAAKMVDDVKMLKLKDLLKTFWQESEYLIQSSPSGCKMKDIAKLTINIPKGIIPNGDISQLDQEAKTDYGSKLFDSIANTCYELLNSRERYKRYIRNMELTHVLSSEETLENDTSTSMKPIAEISVTEEHVTMRRSVDLRYYKHLVDQVPCESQSVGFIFDSLLKQVCATISEKNPMDDLEMAREDFLDNELGQYIDSKLQNLGFESKSNQVETDSEFSNTPTVIKYGDQTSYRLFHLRKMSEIDIEAIEYKMNRLKTLCLPIDFPEFEEEDEMEIRMRKQQFFQFCFEDCDIMSLEKQLKLLCMEACRLKHVGPDEDIINIYRENIEREKARRPLNQEWDSLYIYLKELFKNPSDNLSSDEERDSYSAPNNLPRRLEDYCYSEHFNKETLVQVLHEALELRPYVDSHYSPALDSIFLVLHNPRDSRLLNKCSWGTWIHSNVGFRNYLDFVAESICEWHAQEDIKEQALNQPISSLSPDRELTPEPVKKANRYNLMKRSEMEELKAAEEEKNKKKGKKSRSRSGSPNKRPTTDMQKNKSSDKKDRMGSGKKRTPSARKGGSRMGTGRKTTKTGTEKKFEEEALESETKEQFEKQYQFHGYDIGDDLIHVTGQEKYLFPRDGGLIKIEKTNFVNGNTAVRTAMYKDTNRIILHVINPCEAGDTSNDSGMIRNDMFPKAIEISSGSEKSEEDNSNDALKLFSNLPSLPEMANALGEMVCLSITLDDDLQIDIALGVQKDTLSKYNAIISTMNQIMKEGTSLQPSNVQTNIKANSPKGKRRQEEEIRRLGEIEKQNELEIREKIEKLSCDITELRKSNLSRKNMTIACPDGLHVLFLHDEVDEGTLKRVLYIKQEYPFLARHFHPCEKRRFRASAEEKSRNITMEGTVIKFMMDGSTVMLLADGSVCTSSNQASKMASANMETAAAKETTEGKLPTCTYPYDYDWWLINSKGERFHRKANGIEVKSSDIQLSASLCQASLQVMETREDGTIIIKRPDGTRIVEHNDGTRITTFTPVKSSKREDETGEQEICNFDTIEFIKVESEGFATVLINYRNSEMQATFGNGTIISSSLAGSYKVSKPDTAKIFVSEQGDLAFVPKKNFSENLPSENIFNLLDENSPPTGVYLFRNSNTALFSTVDCEGNKFTVCSSGDARVERAENFVNSSNDDIEGNLMPRYFVVNRDGGGEEALHNCLVSDLMLQADKNPMVAILESGSFTENGKTGITVLRPIEGYLSQMWFKEKDENDIIPFGLKDRDFKTLSACRKSYSGEKFGSKTSVPFQIGSEKTAVASSARSALPTILSFRHLVKFSGLDDNKRKKILNCLDNYRSFLTKKLETEWDPVDPRKLEEQSNAYELSLGLSSKSRKMQSKQDPSEIMLSPETSATCYMKATAPPIPTPQPKATPQRPQVEWEQDKIQMAELKFAKSSLKSEIIPPYFDTEEGQRFLFKNGSKENMEQIIFALAKETVHPTARQSSIQSSEDLKVLAQEKFLSEMLPGSTQDSSFAHSVNPNGNTPSTTFEKDPQDLRIVSRSNGEQRPSNPTPKHASKIVQNNSPNFQPNHGYYQGFCANGFTSTIYDHEGSVENIQADISAPTELAQLSCNIPESSRNAGVKKNKQFSRTEEAARRQLKTASIAGSVNPQSTEHMRGFKVDPAFVDFGVLKEGHVYSFPVFLHNVGVDSCRFKIKQPPPSTGIKVGHKAGSVAAGMRVRLDIEMFAMAVGVEGEFGTGTIEERIEIFTEADIIYLPVTASIITSFENDIRYKNQTLHQPSSDVVLKTGKPITEKELARPNKQ